MPRCLRRSDAQARRRPRPGRAVRPLRTAAGRQDGLPRHAVDLHRRPDKRPDQADAQNYASCCASSPARADPGLGIGDCRRGTCRSRGERPGRRWPTPATAAEWSPHRGGDLAAAPRRSRRPSRRPPSRVRRDTRRPAASGLGAGSALVAADRTATAPRSAPARSTGRRPVHHRCAAPAPAHDVRRRNPAGRAAHATRQAARSRVALPVLAFSLCSSWALLDGGGSRR